MSKELLPLLAVNSSKNQFLVSLIITMLIVTSGVQAPDASKLQVESQGATVTIRRVTTTKRSAENKEYVVFLEEQNGPTKEVTMAGKVKPCRS